MPKARKTADVEALLDMANNYLKNTPDKCRGERLGVASFVESILHRADRYKGYRYLEGHEMVTSLDGKTPGIVWQDDGGHHYPDDSRRQYS
jgi:hypothetical protein